MFVIVNTTNTELVMIKTMIIYSLPDKIQYSKSHMLQIMNPLCKLLNTLQFWTNSKYEVKSNRFYRFSSTGNLNCKFGNSSVPTQIRTADSRLEPLLILAIVKL